MESTGQDDSSRCTEMVAVKWTGRTVSVNKCHEVRAGMIYASIAYKDFINSIAWAIKIASGCKIFKKVSLRIHVKLSNRKDHHNIIKPICDAIERSGLINNDKNIKYIKLMPAERHNGNESYEIFLMISEVK